MKKLLPAILSLIILTIEARAQLSLTDAFPSLTFTSPIELLSPPDGTNRICVVSQKGVISMFPNSADAKTAQTFLDISGRVASGGETGLLGLAFHPDYKTNGYLYVNYTRNNPGLETVISRFTVKNGNPNEADPASELVLLTYAQPFSNHNGGKIAFGPDGYLYIASGDGGSGGDPQNNAQNLSNLLGKILRINVNITATGLNYAIPADNPYAGNTQGFRQEIYAHGLRNPWKFNFDQATGNLWLADVGQTNREEINIIVKGGNYGWRITEGTACYNPAQNCNTTGLVAPVYEYNRNTGVSITGGYVYRGQIPYLQGKYIYGDFGSRNIWALTYANNTATNEFLLQAGGAISSFGEDQFKELYVCNYSNGKIYKFTDDALIPPSNLAVTATFATEVKLTWTDNSYNETGFIVERALNAAGPFTSIDTVATNIATFTDANLIAGTSYFYRVRAFNAATGATSAYSATVPVTITKIEQTIVFEVLPDRLLNLEPFLLSASASSNLPVSFTLVSGPATITGNNLVTLTGKGTVIIRATQKGDNSYNAAPPVERSFKVASPEELSNVTNPVTAATGISTLPALTFKTVEGASRYVVEINTKEDFSGKAIIDSSSTASLKITQVLDTSVIYYARVKTNLFPTLWGQTTSFKTAGNESLSYITSPAEGAADVPVQPQMQSKEIPGATQYTFELSTKPDFSENKVTATSTTQTAPAISVLDSNTIYYSRVQTDFLPQLWGKTVSFKTVTGAVTSLPEQVKKELGLAVFPNPATQLLTIQFKLANPAKVSLFITDVHGRPVRFSVSDKYYSSGKQSVEGNVSNLKSGFYIYQLKINDKTVTGKFQVVK